MEDWRRSKLEVPLPAALLPWKGPCSGQAEYHPWWEEHDRAVARNFSDYPEEAEGLEEAIMMSLRDQKTYPREPQGLADGWREGAAEIEEARRVTDDDELATTTELPRAEYMTGINGDSPKIWGQAVTRNIPDWLVVDPGSVWGRSQVFKSW